MREPVFYFTKVSVAKRKISAGFLSGLEHIELFNHRNRKGNCKMSIPNLPVNFKDDILASSNAKRKYQQTFNTDGSLSLEDVTQYKQKGSEFGASQVNQTNGAVNNIYDERILTLEELELVTEPGYFVDAMAVSDLNGKTDGIVTSVGMDTQYCSVWKSGVIGIVTANGKLKNAIGKWQEVTLFTSSILPKWTAYGVATDQNGNTADININQSGEVILSTRNKDVTDTWYRGQIVFVVA